MKHKETMIDWQRLCLNLRRKKPLAEYAREFDCDPATLRRLARGDVLEPRFSIGLALLNSHVDLLPELHTELLNERH